MAQLNGLYRLGRDGEPRYTPDGDLVINLALAYNYGRKGVDGNRPTQWVDASLWGKLAEALAPYLLKGTQLYASLSDVHIETYQKTGGGEGVRLTGRVVEIELAGGRRDDSQQQQPQQQRQQGASSADYQKATGGGTQRQAPQQRPTPDFSDMDDDIPF